MRPWLEAKQECLLFLSITFRIPEMLAERCPHLFSKVSENLKLLNGGSVGIDIDAVTQATFYLALNRVSHQLGKVIQKKELITYWELANIAKKNGILEHEAMKFATGAWNSDDVYLNAPVMPGISTLLEFFNEIGIPHVFISSRPMEFEDTTDKWFEKTLPKEKIESIILGRKEGTSGGEFKADMINKYRVALHIEDATEEAEIIVKKTNACVLIVPQPWNEKERFEHPRIKYLQDYSKKEGSWPALYFLASEEARDFLGSVAHS